ncbi:IS3 family transposase [Arsenicicoccus dermatophilus]|uniref:IS3 family transposase n=1 Tax=Arsenicicoccus dermatophilus TaxID=1076331 RepID=UPI0039171AB0
MSTTRFCELFDIPERSWRRWQSRSRAGLAVVKGPWPAPSREQHRQVVVAFAGEHPAWGHRKIWAMARHGGHLVSASTVRRILDEEGLLLKADYQRERRQLAAARKAAFADPPTGPNQGGGTARCDDAEHRSGGGSSTSASSRPLAGAPGGSPGSRTTGPRTSSGGTGHRPRTSTTRSPASSSRRPRPSAWSSSPAWRPGCWST